jgi:hypothetical protein
MADPTPAAISATAGPAVPGGEQFAANRLGVLALVIG